jgi:rod shape-determining protein MreC|tara:strand:- start:1965 stop:2813 length:849 start_codon:yes stop_codon:yes gene_type:complete
MINKELKQTQIAQSAIFTTGSMRASKILPSFFLVLSIFFTDFYFDYSKNLKIYFLTLFQPLTEIPNVLIQTSNRVSFFFSSQNRLFIEIDNLNNEIEKLNFEILKLKNLEKENIELSKLMNLVKTENFSISILGEIKSKSFFPKESLNVFTDIKKLNEDMIVLNNYGVVGQISEIYPNYVRVQPLYEKGNIVPSYISRNGLNIILKGKGENKTFTIENLSSEVNLYEGDEIYSSGLGGKFPKGYLIGKVKSISKNQNLKFQEVEVSSSAEFDKGSKVLFISP